MLIEYKINCQMMNCKNFMQNFSVIKVEVFMNYEELKNEYEFLFIPIW